MNIHPLAELFPLIEGKEFDDLVASIRESGQLEPIVTLKGAILDGRNRYRACEAAQVEPRTEEFTGADPLQFVICKNIHRRHLNESQRAMLAAQFTRMQPGDNLSRLPIVEISNIDLPVLSLPQATSMFNVGKDSILAAKKVLKEGTEEEKQAARNGEASVNAIARTIREHPRSEDRPHPHKITEKSKTQRGHTMQMQADIWRRLKDALDFITGLPLPSDVVAIARVQDKKTKGTAVDQRLKPAMEWLTEFSDAWNDRRD